MKINSIKGMHDLLPHQTRNWRQIETILHNFFNVHGYGEIRTPNIEQTKLFKRVIGDETDIVTKEMYSWEDRNGDNISLRPELTAPTVRAFIEHNLEKLNKNTKLYYIGSAFRRERPQKGRQRQFSQFGVEAIGSEFPEQDAEVISMAYNIYEMLGIENLDLVINSVGSEESKKNYSKQLKIYLSDFSNQLSDVSKTRYKNNPLRILDTKDKEEIKIVENAPNILDFLTESEIEHFNQVKRYLDKLGIPYRVDKGLVRGLDYYTMTTFEIRTNSIGSQDALCGGGRYNNLVDQLGGKPIPAIGFAAGMERLVMAISGEETIEDSVDIFILSMGDLAIMNALKICDKLRSQLGINVRMDLTRSSFKSQMRQANKLNANYVVIIGEDEVNKNIGIIKDMSSGNQSEVPLDTIHKNFDIKSDEQ